MPSEARQCFVYLQLPQSLEVVTCARFELSLRSGAPLGRFVYGQRYRERPDAVPLDPFELPLGTRTYVTTRQGGAFGALRDAAPDAWGRRVIERKLGASRLDELAYLLAASDDRPGALSFGVGQAPPAAHRPPPAAQLPALLDAAARLEADEAPPAGVDPQLDALLEPGSSMGGARPKCVVEDDGALWVAKFPMRGDRWNACRVEAATLALARSCGLDAASAKLCDVGGRDVLLVRRFDRTPSPLGFFKHRMVSALTVLQAEDSATDRGRWSYLLLADALRRWVKDPDRDARELFGRAVFNACVSNLDDHPRNHALVAPDRDWKLSPAYDLNPTPALSLERRDLALEAGAFGRWANRENLLSRCDRFGLGREEAEALVARIHTTVSTRWREHLEAASVSPRDCERVAPAFVYPGFELHPKGSVES